MLSSVRLSHSSSVSKRLSTPSTVPRTPQSRVFFYRATHAVCANAVTFVTRVTLMTMCMYSWRIRCVKLDSPRLQSSSSRGSWIKSDGCSWRWRRDVTYNWLMTWSMPWDWSLTRLHTGTVHCHETGHWQGYKPPLYIAMRLVTDKVTSLHCTLPWDWSLTRLQAWQGYKSALYIAMRLVTDKVTCLYCSVLSLCSLGWRAWSMPWDWSLTRLQVCTASFSLTLDLQ